LIARRLIFRRHSSVNRRAKPGDGELQSGVARAFDSV